MRTLVDPVRVVRRVRARAGETVPKLRNLRRPGSYWHLHRYAFDLAAVDPAPRPAGGPPVPELVEVNLRDLDAMRASCPELPERKYLQLKERIGSPEITAYLIRDQDGSWAGYCHLAYHRFEDHYLNHVVRLRGGEVFFVDDAVFASHRRRGLHTFSILRRAELARDRGMRTGLVVINDRNAPSRAAYGHAGTRPVRRLVFVRPFRLMIQIPLRRK